MTMTRSKLHERLLDSGMRYDPTVRADIYRHDPTVRADIYTDKSGRVTLLATNTSAKIVKDNEPYAIFHSKTPDSVIMATLKATLLTN